MTSEEFIINEKKKPKEYQYALLLQVAINQLEYCKVISEYPKKMNKELYDNHNPIDLFYIRTHNAHFIEALMIVCNLLDTDKRTISFFNYQEFCDFATNKDLLDRIVISNEFQNLKTLRDQIF